MMKAMRVHHFGGPEVIVAEQLARPLPAAGQLLLRVKAAGVGPWDAWVRAGQSALPQPLPLTPGSDVAGIVEQLGGDLAGSDLQIGDEVFGVTNKQFTGGYAEYAIVETGMLARKPKHLSFIEAASVPVVASTAWQMLFDHGQVTAGQCVLVHGAAGNVGAYAVQFAKQGGARVIATAYTRDLDYVNALGADRVIDVSTQRFEEQCKDIDVVLDTIGGDIQQRSFAVLKPGGVLVSSVNQPDLDIAAQHGVRAIFFLVDVTSTGLTRIAELLEAGSIRTNVGEVLPLDSAVLAHEMLAGKKHKSGKIVLAVEA
ncbi:MAG TPA: NADP-dependent oxidoreductase [Spongiibacteraceae bacterium]|nr:NADP-dependent oxidoreductase [Spongiibacteraceae bacterium]